VPRTAGRRVAALALVGATAVAAVAGARWLAEQTAPVECVFVSGGQDESLTPEQAANAATIAAVGVQRQLPPRAATIALATAIQESKLRNLRYGDADSQGLFQQRPSQGWGTVEQVTDPVFASAAFYTALEQVPGWQDGVVTEVAQAVQRSAFPDAYADHEAEARVLASVLTGQEGPATRMGCRLDPPPAAGSVQALADKLEAQLGVRGTGDTTAGTVTVELGEEALAWTAGTWAVSHADAEQVTAVTVGSRSWTRAGEDPLVWTAAGQPVGPTTVVVRLHQP
jgi:hypothetical protein